MKSAFASAALVAFSACATVPVGQATDAPRVPADVGEAIACTFDSPCPTIDGVWMPTALAAHLAGAETCCGTCQEELRKKPSALDGKALVWVVVVAAVAGAATAAAGYEGVHALIDLAKKK